LSLRYDEIGLRLKAFRMGSGLSAEEISRRIGISRTALYRFEKGELAKIETLEKLSELLDVSLPTLLGVGIEYVSSPITFYERVRQIEETAEHITILSGPISYFLATQEFERILEQSLNESVPDDAPNRTRALADIRQIIDIMRQRKATRLRRKPACLHLVSALEMERYLMTGAAGRTMLPPAVAEERRRIARAEVEHHIDILEKEPIGVQIGLVLDNLPRAGFQIFRQPTQKFLTISPFRLGEQPNVRLGVAMITSAPEALTLHERVVADIWAGALRGHAAAEYLRSLLAAQERLEPDSPSAKARIAELTPGKKRSR